MIKIIVLSIMIVSYTNAQSLFGNTEEEKIEFQKKIISGVGDKLLDGLKGVGKLADSYVDDYKKEKKSKKDDIEREKAKKELFAQMNGDSNKNQKKEKKNFITVK